MEFKGLVPPHSVVKGGWGTEWNGIQKSVLGDEVVLEKDCERREMRKRVFAFPPSLFLKVKNE